MKPRTLIISERSIISIDDDVLYTSLQEEMAILSLKSDTYFTLNETAAAIWEIIKTPTSFSVIKTKITENFQVPEETAKSDLMDVLQELSRNKLIRIQ